MKKKPTPAPMAIGNEGKADACSSDFTLKIPSDDTIPARVLAIMLKGREVSTPSFTYSPIHATRLPAYIQRLEDMGFQGKIFTEPMPLTQEQLKQRYRKPFSKYYLDPEVIFSTGAKGQRWAESVLEKYDIDISRFPVARAYR